MIAINHLWRLTKSIVATNRVGQKHKTRRLSDIFTYFSSQEPLISTLTLKTSNTYVETILTSLLSLKILEQTGI